MHMGLQTAYQEGILPRLLCGSFRGERKKKKRPYIMQFFKYSPVCFVSSRAVESSSLITELLSLDSSIGFLPSIKFHLIYIPVSPSVSFGASSSSDISLSHFYQVFTSHLYAHSQAQCILLALISKVPTSCIFTMLLPRIKLILYKQTFYYSSELHFTCHAQVGSSSKQGPSFVGELWRRRGRRTTF